MGECGQYFGAGGSEPAGCSQISVPGQHGDQSSPPDPNGEVPQTACSAGGPHLCVFSLGQTQAGTQNKCLCKCHVM